MSDSELRAQARALRRSISRLSRSFRHSRHLEGPTPAQLSALGTLHRDGSMTTGELARLERLKPQSVTRLVAALVARGFLEQIADQADRRRLIVAITAEGRRQLVREMQRRDVRLARQLSRLTATEREILDAACVLIDRLAETD